MINENGLSNKEYQKVGKKVYMRMSCPNGHHSVLDPHYSIRSIGRIPLLIGLHKQVHALSTRGPNYSEPVIVRFNHSQCLVLLVPAIFLVPQNLASGCVNTPDPVFEWRA